MGTKTNDVIREIKHDDAPDYGHEFTVETWEEQGYEYLKCIHCGDAILDADDYLNNGKMCPFRS